MTAAPAEGPDRHIQTGSIDSISPSQPQIKYIVNQLIDNGFNLDPYILSVREAAENIFQLIEEN